MAHWIDRLLCWLLAAFSSLIFFLVITDGRIAFSVPLAFASVLLLRFILQKLPDRRIFCRRERLTQVDMLLRKWALSDEDQALSEIRRLLPDLYPEASWDSVRLIQRLPGGEPLSPNDLLGLHHSFRGCLSLTILCTGPVSPSALSLLSVLKNPVIRLADSASLSRRLLKLPLLPAADNTKTERCRPFFARIAPLIRSVRPIRSSVYLLVFLAMYLGTRSPFYLLSALLFLAQLILYCISRLIASRTPA